MPTNIGGLQLGDIVLGQATTTVHNESVTSTLTFNQTASHTIEALDQTITFVQDIEFSRTFFRTITSTLTFVEDIKSVNPQNISETITWTQTISYDKAKIQELSQSTGFNQTIAASHVASELIVSGLFLTHTRDYDAVFTRSLSESLSLVQTIQADKCTTASNSLVWGQTVSYTKGKVLSQTLEWQQSFVYPTSFARSINSIPGLAQRVDLNINSNQTVAQSLGFNQTIVQARVKGVSQTLTWGQTIVGYASRGVANTLSFGQTIGLQMTYNRDVETPLVFDQPIILNRSHAKEIHHGFGMNSFQKVWRVNTRSLTDTFTVTDQIRFNVYNLTVDQTYSPDQSIEYTHVIPQTVESSLQFNETVGLNRTITASVTSELVFLPTRQIYVGMGDIEFYNVENLQWSLIPAYMVGKKNKPHCVLQVPNGAITLPAPEFGDAENYGGVFTIRRSMNNIPYTHVRTLSLRKLNLPFILAKRKAWELREFLIAHNPELMTLTTWKGDKWFVNLTTNPLELRVSGRYANEDEKVSVELEFEGLKVM